MDTMLMAIGRLAGLAGAVLCAIAGIARLTGAYWLGGFQLTTLLPAGVAGMVLGCMCFLMVLVERSGEREP